MFDLVTNKDSNVKNDVLSGITVALALVPEAVAFAFGDAPGVAKALKECGKEFELVELRGGLLDGKALSAAEVNVIADLPSRDEMLGTLLATFNAPISALARVFNAIKDSKEAGTEAVAETTEESAE